MDNRRDYKRGSHFNGRAMVSQNEKTWEEAEVMDVSSGGLKLCSAAEYAEGDVLWFDLFLEGFLSQMEIKTMGVVRRKIPFGDIFHYGIRFKGLSPEKMVQIDENVHNDRPVSGAAYEAD